MRFVLLHYHIFKNAGSTIEDILDHSFGDRFGKLETPVGEGTISQSDLISHLNAHPGLRAFSSHQIRHPLPEAPGYLFFDICFLRDPLDRLRSFYDYFRQRPNPADPMSDLANRTTLGDFVEGMIRDFPLFVRDNQVNLLACAGDSDEPGPRDLDLAIRRMKETSFLGVVDSFGKSVAAGSDALRAAFQDLDCRRPPVNVSRGLEGTVAGRIVELRDACRPEVFEELLRLTELDRQLVEAARTEVERRFNQIPSPKPHPATPQAAMRQSTPVPLVTTLKRLLGLVPYWRELAGNSRATLFDAGYYGGGLLDFLLKGAYQGRRPHPLFDPGFYLRTYPDVAAAGINPFCHYLKWGNAEGRRPHPLFDTEFYLRKNPDVRAAGIDPLVHYVRHGAAENRKPHPLFEPNYYRAETGNSLVHFLNAGVSARNPHPLFDCAAYLEANPDVLAAGVNPLVHYLTRTRSAVPISGSPDESRKILRLEILDVPVAVHLDADGITKWAAEPQQQPFVRPLSFRQILVQLPNS